MMAYLWLTVCFMVRSQCNYKVVGPWSGQASDWSGHGPPRPRLCAATEYRDQTRIGDILGLAPSHPVS